MIDYMRSNDRCAVFAAMGSGKSVCTLTALDDLSMVEGDVWPALILGPKRVAASVWPRESLGWRHLRHLKIMDCTGNADTRRRAFATPAHGYSVNYEQLLWVAEMYGDDWPFKTIVADELTRLKSMRVEQGSKNSGALRDAILTRVSGPREPVVRATSKRSPRFIGLTGTPAPNGLKDLWGQFYPIDAGLRLGRTFSSFENRWFRKGYDGFTIEPMPHTEREIHDKLKDICLTVEGLEVDLPIFNNLYVDLPAAVRPLYKRMEREMFVEIEGVGIEAFNAAAKSSKLLQLASGSIREETDSNKWSWVHDAKLDALESVVEEAAGMPIVVAYQFVADRERILKRFPKAHALGDSPKEIDRWNNGEYPMLVVHPQAAGHGINLARGGNILVMFGLGWNLESYLQVIERLGPMRQKQAGLNRPVFVHHLLARDTLDEATLERMAGKASVQQALLNAMKRQG